MFIKLADAGLRGEGRGMPCPCKNMASQHIDIERKHYIFIQTPLPGVGATNDENEVSCS
jgi:hypothetical protein